MYIVKGYSMAVVKGIPYNCEGNAPECLLFAPDWPGFLQNT